MRLECFGTGAAEAIPGLYCQCPVCAKARALGGREVRARHLSVVDGDIQFDLGPDFLYQVQAFGFDPLRVRHLIITHAHSDHFTPEILCARQKPYALSDPPALNVIGSAYTIGLIEALPEGDAASCRLIPRRIAAFETMALAPGTFLTALPARHAGELEPFIYVLERQGKRLLYAHDTGPLFPQVTDWLAGKALDGASLDCTGVYKGAGGGHLSLEGCDSTVAALRRNGALKPEAVIVLNHFSHGGGASHAQIEAEAVSRGWIAAYDGIRVEI